jgi:hypothetical protein
MTHCAADVAALAAALPSLGQHCHIDTFEHTHEGTSGQLDLVGLRLPKALPRLTTLLATVRAHAEGSDAAANAAYVAAAARLPLLERLCILEGDEIAAGMPFRRFDAALRLGAWQLLQVGWGDADCMFLCYCVDGFVSSSMHARGWNPGSAVQLLLTALGACNQRALLRRPPPGDRSCPSAMLPCQSSAPWRRLRCRALCG